MAKRTFAEFHAAYEKWQADCLQEYNERFKESRTLYCAPNDGDYEPGDLVEFAEDGDAYPHGRGGTNHISKAVTPGLTRRITSTKRRLS